MASGGNEHRMVFDIRGKRRHVVKVVYAILALLMGASLFLVVGPVNIGNLLGTSSSGNSAATQFEEQAERIERKLVKEPEDADLLLSLTRARANAGNASVAQTSTGETGQTVESVQQYQKASAAWSEYLGATDEPNAGTAQVMSNTLYSLALVSRSNGEAEANLKAAAEAQTIVAEARPSVGSLSTQALFTLYTFDYAGAKSIEKEAIALTNSKFERENFENQFGEVEKKAREFQKQLAEAKKLEKQGAKANPQSLENPLGLGGTSLGE